MKHPSSPSCCTSCSPSTPRAHPGGGDHGHGHGSDEHGHDHDHGHSHGDLPSWPRISAALVLALGAEAAHWGHSQWPALHYLGMALAVVAIALTGLGIYRQGLTDLKNRHLGIHALMAVAVTGAFLIGQWPEAAMVMALYVAAERLEDQAMDRARHAIGQLLASTPSTAQVQQADGRPLFLVNLRWAQEQGLATPALAAIVQAQAAQGRSISLLATPQQVLAWFAVADTLRPEAPAAITQLHALGLQVHLFSGDHPATAHAVATQAGIAHAQGGLLPEDKLRLLADLQTSGPTAMVGDGMNDAPALAQADVGFAMGGAHSTDMAIETADVVLMHDDLRRLPDTVHLSRRTRNVLWQNIALALGIKLVFFALALTGHASMWLAVLADMGVSLLVVANGLRLRRWKGLQGSTPLPQEISANLQSR